MATANVTVGVRLEITNHAEVLRLYHALGDFLMATAPGVDANDEEEGK